MSTLLTLLLIIGVAALSIAIIIGIALIIGWLLTLVLAFSLFEGALLGLLATFIAFMFWHHIFNVFAPPIDTLDEDFAFLDDDYKYIDDDTTEEIPTSSFCKTPADKTWANWFRYIFANVLYEDFQSTLHISKNLSDAILRDMSMRLADATVEGLRRKTAQTRQIRVTKGMLKYEMNEAGLKPYDEDILDFAVGVLNTELNYMIDEIRAAIENYTWDDRTSLL